MAAALAGAWVAAACASVSQPHVTASVNGIFTITGGNCTPSDRGVPPCVDGMSGVVSLVSRTGAVVRITVGRKNPLDYRLAPSRFSARLAPGVYRVQDRVSRQRGGGVCPAFVTRRSFQLPPNPRLAAAVTIKAGQPTYIRTTVSAGDALIASRSRAAR